jgi:hypothetical protein
MWLERSKQPQALTFWVNSWSTEELWDPEHHLNALHMIWAKQAYMAYGIPQNPLKRLSLLQKVPTFNKFTMTKKYRHPCLPTFVDGNLLNQILIFAP